jgi:hypothetical protein
MFTKTFARMAELVDALVSNTSGRKAVPVRSRLRVRFINAKSFRNKDLAFFFYSPCPQRVRILQEVGEIFEIRVIIFALQISIAIIGKKS